MKRRDGAIIAAEPPASLVAGVPRVLRVGDRPVGHALFGDLRARGGVVYLHGFPGSCLEPALVAPRLEGAGLGLLALDRPGYGASEGRETDASDPALALRLAAAVTARYGWERYAVLAVSGAGTAAVAALADPDPRVAGCFFLSVFPPTFLRHPRPETALLRVHRRLLERAPALVRLEARLIARRFGRRPERLRARLARLLPPPDRESLAHPLTARVLEASWARGLAGGKGRGLVLDLAHFVRPLEAPAAPAFPCLSVHGALDRVVPIGFQDHLLRALPFVEGRRWPDEGHFSWVGTRVEEILAVLRGWLMAEEGPPTGRFPATPADGDAGASFDKSHAIADN